MTTEETTSSPLTDDAVSKRLYLSQALSQMWKISIEIDSYLNSPMICVSCGNIFPDPEASVSHFKESKHHIFYSATLFRTFVTTNGNWYMAPPILKHASCLALPLGHKKVLKSGFRNLGNSCYSSSILIALSHARPLLEACIASANDICRLIAASATLSRTFNHNIHQMIPSMSPHRQEDASEFLVYLLDQMMKDKLVSSLFKGEMETSFCCTHCNKHSKTREPFTILMLPVGYKGWSGSKPFCDEMARSYGKSDLWPNKNAERNKSFFSFLNSSSILLENCMQEAFSDSSVTCKYCNDLSKVFAVITSVPEVLFVQIGRFAKTFWGVGKQREHVDFPGDSLDLSHFMRKDENSFPTLYTLVSVVVHSGFMGSGHYVSYGKSKLGNWYLYDDDRVTKVTEDEVFNCQAYILVYVRNRDPSTKPVYDLARKTAFWEALSVKCIADPKEWKESVPFIENTEFEEVCNGLAHGSIKKIPSPADIRHAIITRYPLESSYTEIDEESYDLLWRFIRGDDTLPQLKLQPGGQSIPVFVYNLLSFEQNM